MDARTDECVCQSSCMQITDSCLDLITILGKLQMSSPSIGETSAPSVGSFQMSLQGILETQHCVSTAAAMVISYFLEKQSVKAAPFMFLHIAYL